MAIVKMKKLRLIALRDQRDGLTRALMRLGSVQIREPEGLLSDPGTEALLRPERAELVEGRTALGQLQSAVRILGQYAPEKKKLLSARPMVSEREFLDEEALVGDLALAEEINDWDRQIRQLLAEEGRLQAELEMLTPWMPLKAPLHGGGTKTCALELAVCLRETDMAAVTVAAESVSQAVQLLLVSEDDQQRYLGVIALREEIGAILDAMRATGCAPTVFPEIRGTAEENILRLQEELKRLRSQRQERTEDILRVSQKALRLRLSADRMAAEVARRESVERLRGTDSIVALEGWCPAPELGKLEALLAEFDCAWEASDPSPEEYPDVPVRLKNGRLAEPMNLVTEMYSLPAYNGVDPNPLMAPFFVLFYGIMMADMGYGILMMLASVIALKKMRPRGGTKYLMQLLGMSGVSTFLFGALTGGFFGDLLPQIAMMVNPETTFTALPALFTPLNDTIMILIGSLVLGVVQIFTGMIVSVVHKCKNGEALNALFEEGAWWCILLGAALMVLGVGNLAGVPVILCLGGALLVAGQFWTKKSLVGGLTGLFGAIYNGVTGYFSDILSYSRLMALMLSGSVIASVFNTLGVMTGNVAAFVLIALVGNTLNFALNLLGCFVHDLRLQVLEFFNRFYQDGGKPFTPLHIKTEYVDVIKEDM